MMCSFKLHFLHIVQANETKEYSQEMKWGMKPH